MALFAKFTVSTGLRPRYYRIVIILI